MSRTHIGSKLDSVLEEEGILEEVNDRAIRRVVAWQTKQQMNAQNVIPVRTPPGGDRASSGDPSALPRSDDDVL